VGNTANHIDAEATTAAQLTRAKRPKKLKVARRGSPTSDRSRSRVRNMFKKVEETATPLSAFTYHGRHL
jgi:hypothetical protein